MDYITQALDIFLHLDRYLDVWGTAMGPALYGILFLVVFCETGLVVTPFLPGDSLLFAAGALAARPEFPLEVGWTMLVFGVAGITGNWVNWLIGYYVGPKVFSKEKSLLFNKKHLLRAQSFYEKHGGKAIVIARFIPIIRTFAPFVAGIGKMSFARYTLYNIVGTVAWIGSIVTLGYLFGNQPQVKANFHYVVVAIIVISVIPIFVEFVKARRDGHAPDKTPSVG